MFTVFPSLSTAWLCVYQDSPPPGGIVKATALSNGKCIFQTSFHAPRSLKVNRTAIHGYN